MTSQTDDRRGTTLARHAAPGPGAQSGGIELPVGRAFLVQLASDCDPGGDGVRGRVEHVRTGEATRFQSLPELVAFMMGVIKHVNDAAS
jgi:hypothetical protein